MKAALKNLLKAAGQAPAGTESLDGDLGLVAVLEESNEGPSRLVRIQQGERPVHWSFHLQPGESKPQFYPQDLPFLPGRFFAVAWSEDLGLSGFWSSVPGEGVGTFVSDLKGKLEEVDLPPGLKEVAEKMEWAGKKASAEIWEEIRSLVPPSLVESVSQTAHDIFGREIPSEIVAEADSISAFHTEAGWILLPARDPLGASLTRVFRKGETQRELAVRFFLGVSSITVKERGIPDEDS